MIKLTKPILFKMLTVFPQMEFIDIDYFYISTENKNCVYILEEMATSWFLVEI